MGKGKGKKLFKISYIMSIKNFIELKGLRSGRALYYKKVLSSRTPSNLSLRLKFTPNFNNTYFK